MLFSEPSQDCPEDRVQPAVQTAANNTAAVKTAIFFFINLLIFPGTCLTACYASADLHDADSCPAHRVL